jgi:hypothetical protein
MGTSSINGGFFIAMFSGGIIIDILHGHFSGRLVAFVCQIAFLTAEECFIGKDLMNQT